MKLHLKKKLETSTFGADKFKLFAKVKCSLEETELIKKYRVSDMILMKKKVDSFFSGNREVSIVLSQLIYGLEFSSKEIMDIFNYESQVVEACQSLNELIKTLRDFSQEVIIDYDEDDIDEFEK